jgi:hypothetical protein
MAFRPRGRPYPAPSLDRGSRHGARWWYITPKREMVNYAQHKAAGGQKHADWILFRSGSEAKRWIALLMLQDAGHILALERQHTFDLTTTTPDGLKAVVCRYVADFVYFEMQNGMMGRVIEDSKPSGGLREDIYLLKKKWMKLQYGIDIRET